MRVFGRLFSCDPRGRSALSGFLRGGKSFRDVNERLRNDATGP